MRITVKPKLTAEPIQGSVKRDYAPTLEARRPLYDCLLQTINDDLALLDEAVTGIETRLADYSLPRPSDPAPKGNDDEVPPNLARLRGISETIRNMNSRLRTVLGSIEI